MAKIPVPQRFWGSYLSTAAVDERGIRGVFVHRGEGNQPLRISAVSSSMRFLKLKLAFISSEIFSQPCITVV